MQCKRWLFAVSVSVLQQQNGLNLSQKLRQNVCLLSWMKCILNLFKCLTPTGLCATKSEFLSVQFFLFYYKTDCVNTEYEQAFIFSDFYLLQVYPISSNKRPRHLLNFVTVRCGAYWRTVLIRGKRWFQS